MPILLKDVNRWRVKPPPGTPVELEMSHWLAPNIYIAFPLNGVGNDPIRCIASGLEIPLGSSQAWAAHSTLGFWGFQNQNTTALEGTLIDSLTTGEIFPMSSVWAGTMHSGSTGLEEIFYLRKSGTSRVMTIRGRNQSNDHLQYYLTSGAGGTFTLAPTGTTYETDTGAEYYITAWSSPTNSDHRLYVPVLDNGKSFVETVTGSTSITESFLADIDTVGFDSLGSSNVDNILDFGLFIRAGLEEEGYKELLREPYAWMRPVVRRTYFLPAGGGGAQTLTPSPVNEGAVIAAPTVTPGSVSLTPDPVSELAIVADPTITAGAATLTPDPVNEGAVVPDPVVVNTSTLAPDPVAELAVVADPTLTAGTATLTPDPIASTINIPDPTITGGISLAEKARGRMGITGSVHRARVP